jgi:hypothetical protein
MRLVLARMAAADCERVRRTPVFLDAHGFGSRRSTSDTKHLCYTPLSDRKKFFLTNGLSDPIKSFFSVIQESVFSVAFVVIVAIRKTRSRLPCCKVSIWRVIDDVTVLQ